MLALPLLQAELQQLADDYKAGAYCQGCMCDDESDIDE